MLVKIHIMSVSEYKFESKASSIRVWSPLLTCWIKECCHYWFQIYKNVNNQPFTSRPHLRTSLQQPGYALWTGKLIYLCSSDCCTTCTWSLAATPPHSTLPAVYNTSLLQEETTIRGLETTPQRHCLVTTSDTPPHQSCSDALAPGCRSWQ